LAIYHQKVNSKIPKKKGVFGGFQLPEVRGEKKVKLMCDFIVKPNILNYISFLFYSQIWLNLPKDDHQFSHKH
jgi:hypothetical protein